MRLSVLTRFFPFALCCALWAVSLGCAHVASPPAGPAVSAYDLELGKAFDEAAAYAGERKPAQAIATDIDVAKLQQFTTDEQGEFKIFVFPKLSSQANKTNEDAGSLFRSSRQEKVSRLGAPLEYDVSTLATGTCQDFVRAGPLAKYNGRRIFHVALAKDPSRRCAIIEIVPARMKNVDRSLLRRDDPLRVRLFLDDTYNLQGYEMEKFVNARKNRTLRVGTAGAPQSASSGLSLFPMDIPNFAAFGGSGAVRGAVDAGEKIDRLAIAQVRRQFMVGFRPARCQGTELRYLDYYGTPVEVGWCDSQPFPQYMENSRFVAITQPMSAR